MSSKEKSTNGVNMSTHNGIFKIHDTPTNMDVRFSRRFPPDIESLIFEEACYNKRIVWIRESWFHVAIDSECSKYRWFSRFRSREPVPAIMHVNVNAREIALRHYKTGFTIQEHFNKVDSSEIENNRIYLNPTSDIVCPANVISRYFMKGLRDLKVEKLAVGILPPLNIFRGYFNYAICPRYDSHKADRAERDTGAKNPWIHDQPIELFYRTDISVFYGSSHVALFYCCDAIKRSDNLARKLAATNSLQVRKDHDKGNEVTRAQRLLEWPK
ncbi:hypothetical protein BGAL_0101g00080 [Botrytis galanthina]|uniref:2EXR domain-containing protein n=1 Tax=Botrytis galanthina TaxID=278940 RepID=A0A4V6T708_9HELO|nr:hypothetical protein BGAL_0101g00080 [Botrytis galanthina]